MTTKATRDVIDLRRAVSTIAISSDDSLTVVTGTRQIDDTVIGGVIPNEGTFTNLIADNITLTAGGVLDIDDGTVTGTFNAYYADIAEEYEADEAYEPGTVVIMSDGDEEITISKAAMDVNVFGVISENPAYVLNSSSSDLSLPVAMVGRTPCKVFGPIKKRDRLVTSDIPGVAVKAPDDAPYTAIIGRSLETSDEQGVHVVEITTVK